MQSQPIDVYATLGAGWAFITHSICLTMCVMCTGGLGAAAGSERAAGSGGAGLSGEASGSAPAPQAKVGSQIGTVGSVQPV